MVKLKKRLKILIADDDGQFSRRAADYLIDHGFDCRYVSSGTEAGRLIKTWKPRLVLADLILPGRNALDLLNMIKTDKDINKFNINMMIVSGHNNKANVGQAFKLGAVDYLVKPIEYETLLSRVVFQLRRSRRVLNFEQNQKNSSDEASFLLYLTDLVVRMVQSQEDISEILFNLCKMIASKMDGVRCNIVHYISASEGIVISSNDNRNAAGIQLNLQKYPEIISSVNTLESIAIDDLDSDEQFSEIKSLLKTISFNSMVVCPIELPKGVYGVLSLKMPKGRRPVTNNEMRFISIAAQIAGILLTKRNLSEINSLLDIAS